MVMLAEFWGAIDESSRHMQNLPQQGIPGNKRSLAPSNLIKAVSDNSITDFNGWLDRPCFRPDRDKVFDV